ncbi:IS200/IS605 family transposase [Luteolibacter ambystomatis]|uniref:IS200/IS605 family transposase n=1 Tax=Luteolibacter ambystomatis TaxID=2824561 RepID=A0A975J2Y7_9BACT|nr:IS200/IS605 family transposase [Luteolibacter ambystomatis]QUE53054.1 IS200/IS605 family transposase [Luteolibacter ambystomatis]
MPSTYSCLHVHVIFSTKDRVPVIGTAWRDRLHSFLGSVIQERGAQPVAIGGVADHVHLLIGLKPIHAPAAIVRELKSVSSKWIRENRLAPAFGWQEGYGIFSVGPSQVDAVVRYIANQEEHHRTHTAEEEFRAFLRKAGLVSPS